MTQDFHPQPQVNPQSDTKWKNIIESTIQSQSARSGCSVFVTNEGLCCSVEQQTLISGKINLPSYLFESLILMQMRGGETKNTMKTHLEVGEFFIESDSVPAIKDLNNRISQGISWYRG